MTDYCSACPFAGCDCAYQACETCVRPEGEVTTCPHAMWRCTACREENPCRYCMADHNGRHYA